jgi:hypothetical protein
MRERFHATASSSTGSVFLLKDKMKSDAFDA